MLLVGLWASTHAGRMVAIIVWFGGVVVRVRSRFGVEAWWAKIPATDFLVWAGCRDLWSSLTRIRF